MKLALNLLKFQDIKKQTIEYFNQKSSDSTLNGGQFDFSSSNLSYFIDSMSYIAMIEGFNTSLLANNIFLDSTEIRKNGVSKAKELNYTPKRPYSAKFSGKLVYNGSNFNENSKLIIYSRSPFQGSFGNIYFNMQPIELKYNGNPTELEGEYLLSQGSFQYNITYPTGESNFSFLINNKNVDEENFSLFVVPMSKLAEYNLLEQPYRINELLDYKWSLIKNFNEIFSSKIFYLEEDITLEGFPRIVFGNSNVNATVPSDTDVIICEYFETKGYAANNENLTSLPPSLTKDGLPNTYVYYDVSKLSIGNNFNINNFETTLYQNIYNKSSGGSDVESLDSIKFSAPKVYASGGSITKTYDYLFELSNTDGVGSYSVIGGDELFPDDSKLGNIYFCLTPTFNISEFLNDNNIYISSNIKNEIIAKIKSRVVTATKRHFWNPNYLMVDVIPTIEIDKDLTTTTKNKIKIQVKKLLKDYYDGKYNALQIPFRESTISDINDLESIKSYKLKFVHSFIINNNTVSGITNTTNALYLPVVDVRDTTGNFVESTNFIKTNIDIIKTELLPTEDWNILNKTTDSLSEIFIDQYISKLVLLNYLQTNIAPSDCSLFSGSGGLINPSLHRNIYNRDIKNVKIIDLVLVSDSLYFKTYNYQDSFKRNVVVKVVEVAEGSVINRKIVFSYEIGGIIIDKEVATLKVVDGSPTITSIQKEDLLFYFGIDETKYQFYGNENDKSPFKIITNSVNSYSLELLTNTYTSQLLIDSRNDLFNVSITSGNYDVVNMSSKITNWSFENVNAIYSNIKLNNKIVAVLEINSIEKFRGYIDSSNFNNIDFSQNEEGDYYLFTDFVYDRVHGINYFPNDFGFVGEDGLTKCQIKRTVSCLNLNLLNTNFEQGDIFTSGSDYVVYNEEIMDTTTANFVAKTVDSGQLLPKKLENDMLVKVIVDQIHDVEGVSVTYPSLETNKIDNLYRIKNDLTWESITSKKVFNGDLMIYNNDENKLVGVGWYLVENINDLIGIKCSEIEVVTGGTGYISGENIEFKNASGNLTSGLITASYKCNGININLKGSGYVANESIILKNTDNDVVAGTINVTYKCTSITLMTDGEGYINGENIVLKNLNGDLISGNITVNGGFGIASISISSSDYNFLINEVLTVETYGGTGTGATFKVGSVGNAGINSIAISTSDYGFSTNELLTVQSYIGAGTGASFNVNSLETTGKVSSVLVLYSAYGFLSNQELEIEAYVGTGTGASFKVGSVQEYFNYDRVYVHAEPTSDIESLPETPYYYQIFKIVADIDITDQLSKFVNPPSDNLLNGGDYIIYIGSDKWKIFDDDIYENNIDVVNSNSEFPINIEMGDVFEIISSDVAPNKNFNGQTNTTQYNSGEQIIYIGGDDLWKKFSVLGLTPIADAQTANVGDMVEVVDSGNFNNDSRLSVPLYNGNKLFKHKDLLIYTGTNWVKAKPANVYQLNKIEINNEGFNADLKVDQKTDNVMVIYVEDVHHNVSIGELDYYNGVLNLFPKINERLDDITESRGITPLSDIFKYENYNSSDIQMDIIRFKTDKTEFDTKFNQFIITNVREVETI